MRLITRDDLDGLRLRQLFYGRAGSGKTRLVGSAAMCEATAPSLMLTIGGNPVSIRDYPLVPTIIEIGSMEDFNLWYDFLAAGQPTSMRVQTSSGSVKIWDYLGMTEPFKSLSIDGGTETNLKVFNLILGVTGGEDGDTKVGGMIRMPKDVVRAYQDNLGTMSYWASHFFSLADKANPVPVHVFMTALERDPSIDMESRSEKSESVPKNPMSQKYRPAFLGQVVGSIESYAYSVGRLLSVERFTKRQLAGMEVPIDSYSVAMFVPSKDHVAKDQYGKLSYLSNPTVEQIYKLVYDNGGQPLPLPLQLPLQL